MNEIILSILIPTYNRDTYLKKLLEEIFTQILNEKMEKKIEIMVSDNCSTDETKKVMEKFKFLNINYKYWTNDKNLGADGNFLKLIKEGNGIFCWILGDDEILKKNSLKKIVNILEINKDIGHLFISNEEKENLEIVIVFTKVDLDADGELLEELKSIYEVSGYKVIPVSNKLKLNIDKIKEELKENTVVFAGPSGVGKSSLLNEVDKNFELKTGEVSDKIKRGKHTTRHAELLKLECGGMVADTPGFSSLTLDDIDESELKEYFIEFDKYDECRFGSRCIHENEPSCAVKEAVENGDISKKRYESYIQLLNEIRSGKRRY